MTGLRKIRFPILGLSCGGGGARTVEAVLAEVPGVERAWVNPADATAYVDCEAERPSVDELVAAVEAMGYRAGSAWTER